MGARLRFRAVMMTSIAFILGLVPLVFAEGAADAVAAARSARRCSAACSAASLDRHLHDPDALRGVPVDAGAGEADVRRQGAGRARIAQERKARPRPDRQPPPARQCMARRQGGRTAAARRLRAGKDSRPPSHPCPASQMMAAAHQGRPRAWRSSASANPSAASRTRACSRAAAATPTTSPCRARRRAMCCAARTPHARITAHRHRGGEGHAGRARRLDRRRTWRRPGSATCPASSPVKNGDGTPCVRHAAPRAGRGRGAPCRRPGRLRRGRDRRARPATPPRRSRSTTTSCPPRPTSPPRPTPGQPQVWASAPNNTCFDWDDRRRGQDRCADQAAPRMSRG